MSLVKTLALADVLVKATLSIESGTALEDEYYNLEKLAKLFDCSSKTIQRRIEEAKHLGVEIVAIRKHGKSIYWVENARKVENLRKLESWLRQEISRRVDE